MMEDLPTKPHVPVRPPLLTPGQRDFAGHQRVHEGEVCAIDRARDGVTGESVAIKTALPGAKMERNRSVLLNEAGYLHILQTARHAHVIRMVGLFASPDDAPQLVMEWVDAPTLLSVIETRGERLGGEAFDPLKHREETRALLLATLAANGALRFAHKRSVIHRDVKPGNIMHNHASSRLIDFGSACLIGGEDRFACAGTAIYMSPEQVAGDEAATAKTDCFGLGATLYHGLTGVPPYLAPTEGEILDRAVRRDCRPLTDVNPRVPRKIAEQVLQWMHPTSNERPTMHYIRNVLRSWIRKMG